MIRAAVLFAAAAFTLYAGDPVAARLARDARKAQDQGQVVRAYMLFSEAAARDPQVKIYAVQRDAMKPLADLMTKANVVPATLPAEVAADVKKAESAGAAQAFPGVEDAAENGLPSISRADLLAAAELLPPPSIQVSAAVHDFDLHADAKSLITEVARAWGVEAVFDPDFVDKADIHFVLTGVNFRGAMDGLTAATGTFLFAVDPHRIFLANDSELKRNEFEPEIALAVALPQAMDPKEMTEAANAVRTLLAARGVIAFDSDQRRLVVRDHITRALATRALLETLLLPKPQVRFEIQLISVDTDVRYQYGVTWQNTFQLTPLGAIAKLNVASLQSIASGTVFFPFGGGATLFGLSMTDANLFATYSKSKSRVLYDAMVLVADGQAASLHVGDKYPIPTSTYAGAAQSTGPAAYNPIGQVTQEDLGLKLKLGPHIHGDGRIGLDLEASYETLGSIVLDSVPSVNERALKGAITLEEGQWAIIGGLEGDTKSVSRSGIAGLSSLPGLGELFTQTTREHITSKVLVVIKPTITRLPMSAEISPQFLLGPQHGSRVILF